MQNFNNFDSLLLLGLENTYHWLDKVSAKTKIPAVKIKKKVFADKEILVEIPVSVREKDVFLCQSTSSPANETIMELLITIDALKRASVRSISLVIPYFGYSRQDRKAKGREPITAKLIANLISYFKIKRIITFDLHSPQIQGFFDIPIDHLTLLPQMLYQLLYQKKPSDFILVAPDHGSFQRVKKLNDYLLDTEIAILNKIRPSPNQTKVDFILGNVTNKNIVLIDDMIDTANTLVNSLHFLQTKKIKNVYILASHPVLSDNALKKLAALNYSHHLKEVWLSDTIPLPDLKQYPFVKVYSVAKDISKIIQLILKGGSLSQYGLSNFSHLQTFKND